LPPLDQYQRTAVGTRKGIYNIVAVPGAGKTTVFCARCRSLLDEGLNPRDFLGLTFTKSAAEEMEKRAKYKSGDGKPRIMRTFHGWALDFATQNHMNFGFPVQPHPLLLPHDLYKVLGPIVKNMPKRAKYRDVQSYISEMKRKDIDPDRAREEADNEIAESYAWAYKAYEKKCRELGKFDFDSLLSESVNLLEDRDDLLVRIAPQFLQCDEAQDNDAIQWRLIQLLGRHGNVFVVGDPEQNMYTWRGSEAKGLTEEFNKRFPQSTKLILPINYRSTGAIIEYLQEIADNESDWKGMKSALGYGEKPKFKRYIGEDQEAELILQSLVNPEETAILARTNRQLGPFEKAAAKFEMKYKLLGKSGFFSQHEVESTVAFAQFCCGGATDDAVKKIIKSPFDACRFIKKQDAINTLERMQRGSVGRASFAKLLPDFRSGDPEQDRYVRELTYKLRDTYSQIKGKSSQDALRNIITNFGILRHYEDDEDQPDNQPADNIMTLMRMAEKKSTLMEFVNLCHKAKQASRSTQKRLTFSTIHQSKGLEWKYVYVIGVNDGLLPHKNGDLPEEWRIYRVACSRAACHLQVSTNDIPSSFICDKVALAPMEEPELDLLKVMYENAANGVLPR
jgi:superfamily I DNA/RNA helicase